MTLRTATLTVEVQFDDEVTNAWDVAEAVDTLVANATSTEGVLDEVGSPHIDSFAVFSIEEEEETP